MPVRSEMMAFSDAVVAEFLSPVLNICELFYSAACTWANFHRVAKGTSLMGFNTSLHFEFLL